jgi:uncharacterized protein YifN (PemK superfamily)
VALIYSPKVGELLECNFGDFLKPPLEPIYNGLISPEIRKRRIVAVVNGRLPNGCCLVIPISSSHNPSAVQRGFHIHLGSEIFKETKFHKDNRDRWALCECITHVSKQRLFRMFNNGLQITTMLSSSKVTEIQKSIIRTSNAQCLIHSP